MNGNNLREAIYAYLDEQERQVGGGTPAEHNRKVVAHQAAIEASRKQLTTTVEELAKQINTPGLWRLANWLRRPWNYGDVPSAELIVDACAELDMHAVHINQPSPALSDHDVAILGFLAEEPLRLRRRIDIEEGARRADKTVRESIQRLLNIGYVEEPQGRRAGIRITQSGLKAIGK